MPGVRISRMARRDLDRVWHYVAIDSEDRADSLIHDIMDTIKLAATFPGGGSDRSDLRPKLRSYPAGNYIVLFRKKGSVVEIARVLHGARNLSAVFGSRRPKQ